MTRFSLRWPFPGSHARASAPLLWILFALGVPAFTAAGIIPGSLPFVAVFLFALAAMFVWDAWQLGISVEGVSFSVEPLLVFYKDRAGLIQVSVKLPASLDAVDAALELPVSFLQDSHTARASRTASFSVTPQRRGEFEVRHAFVLACSAWGFWRRSAEKPLKLLVKVFPDLSKDPASRRLFSTLQQGQRVQRLVGRGREVERLRDYAAGDSFDEVYWKATARRGCAGQ